MLLRMLEEGMPVDVILFCDTGIEFDGMYRHIEKLEQYKRSLIYEYVTGKREVV